VIEDSIPGVTAAVSAGMKIYGHAALTSAESLRKAGATPFGNMFELKTILNSTEKMHLNKPLVSANKEQEKG
jgi:beta-phosphoglucomutase-like phosphatase (HAD superfamily)